MYPLKFEPILKQTLWGGDKIIPFKHLNDTLANVGESWEVSAVEGSESIVAMCRQRIDAVGYGQKI